jgi:hypothetical protein
MAIQNPTNYVSVRRLGRFEEKLALKYATKEEAGADYASVQTCQDIISELT